MKEAYAIRRLKWTSGVNKTFWEAHVALGSYTIQKWDKNFHEGEEWKYQLRIHFQEYYDESYHHFDALFKAKKFAWEDWKKRILPALRRVDL